MSFMRGDLLKRTRKLVQGYAKKEPKWLKTMEEAPPVSVRRVSGKIKKESLPEDFYVKKFLLRYPESIEEDSIRLSGIAPPSARAFGWRVLELKKFGVEEDEAVSVAFMEYRAERKEKKAAYRRLKEIARIEGTPPPPNPFPSSLGKFKETRSRFPSQQHAGRLPGTLSMKEISTMEMYAKMTSLPNLHSGASIFQLQRLNERPQATRSFLSEELNECPRESDPLQNFSMGGLNGRPQEAITVPSFFSGEPIPRPQQSDTPSSFLFRGRNGRSQETGTHPSCFSEGPNISPGQSGTPSSFSSGGLHGRSHESNVGLSFLSEGFNRTRESVRPQGRLSGGLNEHSQESVPPQSLFSGGPNTRLEQFDTPSSFSSGGLNGRTQESNIRPSFLPEGFNRTREPVRPQSDFGGGRNGGPNAHPGQSINPPNFFSGA